MTPIQKKRIALMELPWSEFFKALPEFLLLQKSVKKTTIKGVHVFSYYLNESDWCVWVEW